MIKPQAEGRNHVKNMEVVPLSRYEKVASTTRSFPVVKTSRSRTSGTHVCMVVSVGSTSYESNPGSITRGSQLT